MDYLTERKYSFISRAPNIPDDTFAVVNFKGFEGISKPYEFNIMLVSDNPEIDLSEVLKHPATFTIHREEGDDVDYHGILAQFEQLQQYNEYVFYRTLLVPKLWWLTLTHHNQVCLNNSVPEIIENTLKDGGLFSSDFEFKIQKEYPAIDYVCQYEESHFNFISRWAEREGIYYYFEQTENGERIIFTDTKISHTDMPREKTLYFSPPSGLDTLHRTENIKSFTCRQRQLPAKVLLKDYNYERPSLGISGTADVDENGRGTAYIYGEHFPTTEEGNRLAAIRAEELLCKKIQFFGESAVPFMEPGYTFTLEDHYRDSFNNKYLIEEVTHEGSQTGYLISGIRNALSEMEERVYYLNHFTAIPADVQFRPGRTAQKPRISGTLHAKIDAEGSGRFAELDDQGRYKVRLPFDINDEHGAGKASSFVRMMQPYAGNNYGVHFPLHKGADVHLSYVNGDPDRPVISGAVPNPETISPVTGANQTQSVFRDNYGNELIFDSTPGDEHIRLHSPHHNSTLELGKSLELATLNDCIKYEGGNALEFGMGNKLEVFAGNAGEIKAGISAEAFVGLSAEFAIAGKLGILLGDETELHWGPKYERHWGHSDERSAKDCYSGSEEHNIIRAGHTLNLIGGIYIQKEKGEKKGKKKGEKILKKQKKSEKVSLLEADDKKLSISYGKNIDPVKSTKSILTQVLSISLIVVSVVTGIIAALIGAVTIATLVVAELLGKEEEDRTKQTQAEYDKILSWKIAWNVLSGILIGIEIFIIIATIIISSIAKTLKKDDDIIPVSHTDAESESPDSLIQLEDKRILIAVEPKVGADLKIDPKSPKSQIEMHENGNINIFSKENEVTIGRGSPGNEKARFYLSETDQAEVYSGKSWLKLYENGGSYLSGNKKLNITSRNGDMLIRTNSGTGGSINIESNKAMKIECTLGDINISPKAGKTKIKGFMDLGG